MRDEGSFYPIVSKASGPSYITRARGMIWFPQPVTDNVAVAQRNTGAFWEIITMRLDAGVITARVRGNKPFPSLDGRTIYFVDPAAPKTLLSLPLTEGAPSIVATLPGDIYFGTAGPDGLHLLLDTANTFVGYRVLPNGTIEAEGTTGLVAVAPTGGWRAITVMKKELGMGAELLLVPPGTALDQPRRRLDVDSIYNRWLDDHRISYCVQDHCEILDVTTDQITSLPLFSSNALMATVTPDGTRVLESIALSHVTRHIITNFGDR
jgi:hypothetical protein